MILWDLNRFLRHLISTIRVLNTVQSMNFIDAHSHLQDPRVDPFRDEWIRDCKAQGIQKHLLGGVDPEDWQRQQRIAARVPGFFRVSFGLHPWWVAAHESAECEEGLKILDEMLGAFRKDMREDFRPWAIGETGLDFHERFSPDTHPRQSEIFEAHLERAGASDLPLILHVVRAHDSALQILNKKSGILRAAAHAGSRGIVHSFSGGSEVASEYRRLGFLLSFSAAVLTRGSGKAFDSLKTAVLQLSPTDFVFETDAPDQPPADRKGRLNHPLALFEVARVVAQIRGGTAEEWLEQSAQNLRAAFGV